MCEVLSLDTVVAVNLGRVEQAAKTESVQADREDVPGNMEYNIIHMSNH